MDDKSNSDTNNNEAQRLANHSSNESTCPPPSVSLQHTAPVCLSTASQKHVDSRSPYVTHNQNGGHGHASSPSNSILSSPEREPQPTRDDPQPHQPENYRVTDSPPEGSTEASTSQRDRRERGTRCKLCGKKCHKPSDFKLHLVYHLGKKPFKCTECGKRFQVKSNMLLHQRAAHGDRYKHEFLECPPGVVGTHTDMEILCDEKLANDAPTTVASMMMSQSMPEGDMMQLKRDAGMSDRSKSDDSPGSCKGNGEGSESPDSHSGQSRGSGCGDALRDEDYTMEYPSVFPGLKHQLQVRNETVLVTRLDGLNKTTKEKLSLFKCHMCGKIFNFLSKLQCHLSLHFERTLNVFVCTYCDAHFQFKTQLSQHLRRSHEVEVTSREDILDMTELCADGERSPPSDLDMEAETHNVKVTDLSTNVSDSRRYSGYTSGDVSMTDVAGGKNSGSPTGGATSGPGTTTPSSPRQLTGDDDERLRYMSAGALYSRVNGLYMCQFCNKGFDRLFSLSRHERVHTGFKPCYCKYCGRGFSEPRNLRHHIIRFHSEGGEGHLMKRLRRGLPFGSPWRVNRRVSHSSQRLAYIPPELVARSDVPPENKLDSPSKVTGADNMAPSHDRSDTDPASPPREHSQQHQQELPQESEPQQPIVIKPMNETPVSSSNKELANEIREKEKLDEDVTVVIPSDVPIEGGKDHERQTPKSVCSENTNWSGTISETEAESLSMNNDVIMSAPIKSLIGHHTQLKVRRKMSFTATTPTMAECLPTYSTASPLQDEHIVNLIKPKMEPPSDPPTSTLSGLYAGPDNPLTAVSAALSLPFNPLNISTYMTSGLGGLLPSPLISPLNQAAFFAQQGLTSPSMVPNPLSFFSPIPSPVGVPTSMMPSVATTTPPTTVRDTSPLEQSPGHGRKAHSPSGTDTNSAAAKGSLDDLQSWMSKGGGRGSALSRSHSSRLYVVRQPVKREEACKPVVLPDGRTVYRCTYCNKDFCTFSDVNRHMDFHEDIRPYKCKFCDYYARTNSQLKVHMMRHQGIREFHCKLCNYKGVTQSDLNRHMKSQIHMMKAQNECKHCGEGFVSPKNLERHYHEKHFSQYEKMASSHAAAAAAAAAAAHASKLGQGPGFQGNA